jgi:hypothetical protein
MKKLAIFLIIMATVFAMGCKKLPEFTPANGSSGGGDTPTTVTPEVVTSEATEITENFAMLNGVISNYDESYTYERGFYWGTTAELGNFLSADDFGHGTFGAKFAGLTANTTYYFKAYAIISGSSSENAGYGEVKSFTTAGSSNLTVTTLEASEISSTTAVLNGMISNFGNDASEYECAFVWGTGTPTNYNNNVELWTDGKFNLALSGLEANTTYKFQAFAKKALTNDDGVYGEILEFTTSSGGVPEGAINGLFTINSNGDQVYFSKGNLQYQASTNTWRFAENQWDFVGDEESGNVYENSIKCNNKQISQTYTGWIDLFGWGTSGYNHGAACYQPWSTSTNYNNYNVYGSTTYNLSDQNGKADWGYNAIINGGNTENLWRTLTSDEWNYVFNNRITNTSIRYAKAQVNGVNGMLLLPDEWSTDYYALNNTDNPNATYSTNVISTYDWTNNLESFGAVFLPACSFREGTSMGYVGIEGDYWSATHYTTIDNAYRVYFYIDLFGANSDYHRHCGHGVRLVHNAGK